MKKSLLYLLKKIAHHPTYHLLFRSCPDNTDVDIKLELAVFETLNYHYQCLKNGLSICLASLRTSTKLALGIKYPSVACLRVNVY